MYTAENLFLCVLRCFVVFFLLCFMLLELCGGICLFMRVCVCACLLCVRACFCVRKRREETVRHVREKFGERLERV